MIILYNIIHSGWQIGFFVWCITIFLELVKPGFILSHINTNLFLISLIILWLIDVLRPVEKVRKLKFK